MSQPSPAWAGPLAGTFYGAPDGAGASGLALEDLCFNFLKYSSGSPWLYSRPLALVHFNPFPRPGVQLTLGRPVGDQGSRDTCLCMWGSLSACLAK